MIKRGALSAVFLCLASLAASAQLFLPTYLFQHQAGGTAKSLTFVVSENKTTTCTSPCTFSNGGSHFNIGSADSTRIIHAIYSNNASSPTVTSATICGVAATNNVAINNTAGTVSVTVLSAAVPTGSGATCDVVLTLPGSSTRGSVGVWISLGYGTAVANSTGSANNCTTACAAAVTPTTGGYIVAAGMQNANGTAPTWTNLTSRWTTNYAGNAADGGGDNATASGSTTITENLGSGGASNSAMAVAAF